MKVCQEHEEVVVIYDDAITYGHADCPFCLAEKQITELQLCIFKLSAKETEKEKTK